MHAKSAESVAAAERMRREGKTLEEIGELYGVSSAAIWWWLNPTAQARKQGSRTYQRRCKTCDVNILRGSHCGFCEELKGVAVVPPPPEHINTPRMQRLRIAVERAGRRIPQSGRGAVSI
jgi:hypothetical protein